ncbi:MAG TPA: hypothetical protein VMV08_05140 [Gaiellaceae bacterium]|nr:hypothetical protein [Gaiellaceae bacterium]
MKSANRAVRAAERSVLAGLRPLLMPSRPEDAAQQVGFVDLKWMMVPGGRRGDRRDRPPRDLDPQRRHRNSVLHGWQLDTQRVVGAAMPDPEAFIGLSRDLYAPAGAATSKAGSGW